MINGKKHSLDLIYESSGTKQLISILKSILLVLTFGGVAAIDEMDVNLHPEIVLSIVDLFTQPETNPHNAQLLFSTHSHIVLTRLNKYQILIVEKNKNAESEAHRLDEIDSGIVRSDNNYYLKYMSGAYGGYPNIH